MCEHPDYFLSKRSNESYVATCSQCGEQVYYVAEPDTYEVIGEYVFNLVREEEKEIRRTKTRTEEEEENGTEECDN